MGGGDEYTKKCGEVRRIFEFFQMFFGFFFR